jgi:ribosomal protein L5
MNVTIVISGRSNDESRELLRGLGLPFKAEDAKDKKGAA